MDKDEKDDVVLIDAHNLIYRAFHGNQSGLTNGNGLPTNAIFTTCTMLFKLRKQFTNLKYGIAVFDGEKSFRDDLYEDYKANRKPMPEELSLQLPYLKEVFKLLGWSVMVADGVEADDVLGTLGVRSAKKRFNTYIISGDKDFRQLVNDNLFIIDTMQEIFYDRDMVKEKMGVYPENVVSYLSLLGDSSDNVIGVDKVGKKTAVKLLELYGNLDGIIENKDKIQGVVGENIRKAIEDKVLEKNVELITLKTDVDLDFKKSDILYRGIRDYQAWADFCKKMNFNSFLKNENKLK